MAKERKARLETVADWRAFEQSNPRNMAHSQLLYLMHELSRMISVEFDRAMTRHHLTHSQWWALMHISEHEGATQTELAGIMQLGRASAGKVIERLEAKGWIERRPDPADSRLRRVFLGDAAVPIFETMAQEGARLFGKWMNDISPKSEELVLRSLRRIKDNAERG